MSVRSGDADQTDVVAAAAHSPPELVRTVHSRHHRREDWLAAAATAAATLVIATAAGAQRPQNQPEVSTTRLDAAASSLARAISAWDTAAVIEMMTENATLTQSDRTIVTGAADAARALLRTRFSDGVYRLLFEPMESVRCLAGAVQTGRYIVMQVRSSDQESVERGTMAVSWTPNGQQLRVDRIALVADGNAVGARSRLGARCSRLDARAFAGRRFELSLMPASMAGWQGADHLESALADRGWTRAPAIDLFRRAYEPTESDVLHRGRTDPGMIWVGGVSLRVSPHLRVAASVQPAPTTSRLLTYNETESSRLTQSMSVRETTLGLTAENWHLRAGLGAALVTSSVQERYEHLVLHDPTSPDGAPGRGTVEDEQYSPSSIGAVGSLQYSFPVTSRTSLGVIGRSRIAPPLTVKGVETHRDWTYDVNGSYAGLLATVAW